MKIYHYDPLTRLFLYEEDATPDPLVEGEFLVPAWATGLPPLTKVPAGQQTFFDGDKWALQDIPPPPEPESSNPLTDDELVAQTKAVAKKLLQDTDYTQMVDISSSLHNFDAFVEYRRLVRDIFLHPIKDPKWPEIPTPVWD